MRPSVPTAIHVRGSDALSLNGQRAAAWPVLQALDESGTCSIDDLYTRTEGTLTRERLRLFLKELVNTGLASIVVDGAVR
jgi:hypothetical protein